MVELDKLRVSKLKCLSCGCRDKRVALLKSSLTGKRIGFVSICCNCGELRTYISRNTRDKRKDSLNEKEENLCCCECQENKQRTDKFLFNNEDILRYLMGEYEVSDIFCVIPDPYCPRKNCPLYPTKPKAELTMNDLYENDFFNSIYENPYKEPLDLRKDSIEKNEKFL